MKTVCIESHYFPSIAYFRAIHDGDRLIIEVQEYFVKQTYRNRCEILTANGVDKLIVPLTANHGKVSIRDVRIDYSQKWLNGHWRAIQSAYGNAPFFEFYTDDLHKILFSKKEFLLDLNMALLTICLKWLKLRPQIAETVTYEKNIKSGIFKNCTQELFQIV